MNCLIAIGHRDVEPWNKLREAQESTWIPSARENFDVLYFLSKEPPKWLSKWDITHEKLRFGRLTGRAIGRVDKSLSLLLPLKKVPKYFFNSDGDFVADSYSTYLLINRRTLSFYQWIINETDYSHFFSTTVSSYIDVERFSRHLKAHEYSGISLAGSRMNIQSENISGSGRLVSREFIEYLFENLESFEAHRIDDMAISTFAIKHLVNIRYWDRLDITDTDEFREMMKYRDKSNEIFHYRIKTNHRPKLDVEIMKRLHYEINPE